MPSPILQVQFAFLSYLARFFQPHARREQHDGIDFSCRMRAYGNTTHTGYTLLFICFCRFCFIYGSDGTVYGTSTAPNAILIRSGYETARRSLFIEMTSGNFRNRTVAVYVLFFGNGCGGRRRFARNACQTRKRHSAHISPCGDEAARQNRGRRQNAGSAAACRQKGTCRTRYARGSGQKRPRKNQQIRLGSGRKAAFD